MGLLSETLRHKVMLTGQGKLCVSRLRPLLTRLVSSSAPASGRIPDGFGKIKERQKFFNLDNGLRVHERGGMKDSALYNFTVLLIFLGAVEYCRVLYRLVFPKSDWILSVVN